MISEQTGQILDEEDLRQALYEHSGAYVPSGFMLIAEAFGIRAFGSFEEPDNHWSSHVDRFGSRFHIVTSDYTRADHERSTVVFMDHEIPDEFAF